MQRQLVGLVHRYPRIFPDGFYFECLSGWHDLIDTLCCSLQERTDQHGDPQIKATQIKEKFGTLRFYVEAASHEQYALIEQAEEDSARTCDLCGAEASMLGNGWMMTRCHQHSTEI